MPTAHAFQQRRWLALAAVVLTQFTVVLDVSIVNVALPSIRNDLHFSLENPQWVLTAYAIVFGGVLLLGGRLADPLGRRRVFSFPPPRGATGAASPLSGAALTHGFQIAFYVPAALVVLAAITAAAILASKPPHPVDEVDRASRMAPEQLRQGGTAADLAPERSA
jgi:MFS family permease